MTFHAAPSEDRSARRSGVLVRPPTTCQQYFFEFMKNFSEPGPANKIESDELRTTHPNVCCMKYASLGDSPGYPDS